MSNIYWDIETNGLLNKIDEKRITCIGLLHNDLGVRIFSGKNGALTAMLYLIAARYLTFIKITV